MESVQRMKTWGEYSKACLFYEQAVKIAQQSLPTNHADRQIFENNLEDIKRNF